MNYHQQHYSAHAGNTPVSSYYAARQRFEQQQQHAHPRPAQPAAAAATSTAAHSPYSIPFRSRSSVDLSNPPPMHPAQQQRTAPPPPPYPTATRATAAPPVHPAAQTRSMPTQYNMQQPLYKAPYAGASTQAQQFVGQSSPTRTHPSPAYGQHQHQHHAAAAAAVAVSPVRAQSVYTNQGQPGAPYAVQRTYSHPTPSPTSAPAPAPAMGAFHSQVQSQHSYFAGSSTYGGSAVRPPVVQQQQQQRAPYPNSYPNPHPHPQPQPTPSPAPSPTRSAGPPFTPSGHSPQPRVVQAPTTMARTQSSGPPSGGVRRPLPMPTQGAPGVQSRPRPLSMPPQAAANISVPPPSVHGSHHHSSSASLSHIIPQSSFPSSAQRPTSPFMPNMMATRSESPTRRPLPSPTPSHAPLPPTSSSAHTQGMPRTVNMNFNRTPSPEKQTQSAFVANGVSSTSSSPTRPTSRGRTLPTSPTAPPDISQLQRGSNMLARRGTVSAMVSRFGGNPQNENGGNVQGAVQIPSANDSYTSRLPARASTQPPPSVAPPVQPPVIQVASNNTAPASQMYSDEEEYQTADEEETEPTKLNVDQTVTEAPSPQYGILDLPKRSAPVYRDPSPDTLQKVEPPSPQYGIKNLPMRSKSVIDRRIAWERAEKGIVDSTTPKKNFPVTEPSSPTKSMTSSSSPTKSVREGLRARREPVPPSQSPQPQLPKEERKLPMPVVHHPQPSYTERQPSWTLPTADLDKINEKTHQGGQMTSNAFRFAAMSLAEDKDKSAPAPVPVATAAAAASRGYTPGKPPAQLPALPKPPVQVVPSSSGPPSPKKAYPFTPRIAPRTIANVDIDLDDAPPPSLRRSPSPGPSSSSSSIPSIPTIRTPEETVVKHSVDHHHHHHPAVVVPIINLPGDADFDNDDDDGRSGSMPAIRVHVTGEVVSPKPTSPRKQPIPAINLPGEESDEEMNGPSGPVISITGPGMGAQHNHTATPKMHVNSMPVILNDLASSGSSQPDVSIFPHVRSDTTSSMGSTFSGSGSGSGSVFSTNSNSGSGLRSETRSRRGGLVCGGCGKGILGRIVSAMGLRWHPNCFKCCTCGELLEHVSSYEHDGKPYCHLDYHELFAPRCYHCKTPIIDERFITLDDPALGKRTYHEQHFFCAECGDPFLAPSPAKSRSRTNGAPNTNATNSPTTTTTSPGKAGGVNPNEISIKGDGAFDVALDEDGAEVGFTVYRGHPYCEACHVRLRAPKCKACKRSIRDGARAVEALGGKWCFECFVCAMCQKPFEEPSFFQREKKPYCEPCFSIILRNEI